MVVVGANVDLPSGTYLEYGTASSIVSIDGLGGAYYGYYSGDYGGDAAAQLALLRNSKAPASVWTNGWPYVQQLEYTKYIDDGATAYDAVDGFIPITSITYQLCSIPTDLQDYLQTSWLMDDYSSVELDITRLSCKATNSLNSYSAGNLSQVSNLSSPSEAENPSASEGGNLSQVTNP